MAAITTDESPPILQIRNTGEQDWSVAATWPDGRSEEISGFKNESEANEWIATKFQAWLDNQKHALKGG
jgi:hypothetical protein